MYNRIKRDKEEMAQDMLDSFPSGGYVHKTKSLHTHPLLNQDSKHYSMVDDVEAIERMEQMYTTKELMIWANCTAMKYRLRIGNKDDVAREAKKIDTYEAYYRYLKELA